MTTPQTALGVALPRYLTFSDLADEEYGLTEPTLRRHMQRGHRIVAAPDATSSAGLLWGAAAVTDHRVRPNAELAAIAPVDARLGSAELAQFSAYLCPDRSGRHIGWASPSVIGTYGRGGLTEWTTVRAIARYPEGVTTPAAITAGLSPADQATADAAATARRAAGFPGPLTVYLLDRTAVLGVGTVDLGTNSDGKHLGLRQGKLLRAEHHQSKIRVGGGSSWLTLPGSGAPHQDFAPPLIDVAFP